MRASLVIFVISLMLLSGVIANGAPPSPVLTSINPSGGQVGQSVVVTLAGNLNGATGLRCSLPDVRVEPAGSNQFRVTIPTDAVPGCYHLQAVTANGLSSPGSFVVGHRPEIVEREPNQEANAAQSVPIDVIINGQIDRGDTDRFTFAARRGQRVILDCQADRIDSRLRAVLELFDESGRRLAVNRGYYGFDPLIDFPVPADGNYTVKLSDLVYSGGGEHFYRLSIDTSPRVAFTVPNVVEHGKTTPVTLYGWNLVTPTPQVAGGSISANDQRTAEIKLDSVTVNITAPTANGLGNIPLRSNQLGVDGFSYLHPGSDTPVVIGLTDVPVVTDRVDQQTARTAYEVSVPCEISGQLIAGDERDWFAISVRRGEVIYLEAYGDRLGSPVDLDLSVFDPQGETELAAFHDWIPANETPRFSLRHTDPIGRWVAPADGRYMLRIRNVIGGTDPDPRRQYRLSLRREEPDFQLVAVPRTDDPAGINVPLGGTYVLDLLAIRQRGLSGSIRVSAKNLPLGVECPEIWLGPGVNSAPLVISTGKQVAPFMGTLHLEGYAELAGTRPVRGGSVSLKSPAGISSRIVQEINYAGAGEAPLRLVANGHEVKNHHLYGDLPVRHAPGSIVDVTIDIERRDAEHQAPVKLTGIGLPDLIDNQTAIIPAGSKRGTISFYLPPTIPVGKYTLAIQGETTVPTGANTKPESITVISNSVVLDVQPAAFIVAVDAFAPQKIRRGQIVQLPYTARRINGFIGKIHTEPSAPGEVIGLRGRGVTFVGATETGSIQFIASDDAPLGKQPFVRLLSVGTVEDQPVFQGSCFLELEIVE